MKLYLKKLHRTYYLFWVGFFFISLYPFIYVASRTPASFKGMNRLRLYFSSLSSVFGGIFYRFKFETEIDWSKNYIICSNHTSNLDITALILLIRKNYLFMGKDELLDNMVTGIYFRTIDIPLNRDSKMSAFRAFKKAEEALKSGKNLVIFPEGMISEHYPPVLQSFKNGPFKLAFENKVAILPVTLKNNWKRMWDDGSKFGTSPGICDICVHAPIDITLNEIRDAEELRDRVFEVMQLELQDRR